ncbi:MAG: HDIG domain-containing metalloprotein [Pseudomonadota bacterium]
MTRVFDRTGATSTDELRRRLSSEADRRGNADGTADTTELHALATELQHRGTDRFDADAALRLSQAQDLAAGGPGRAHTLDPALMRAPEPLRRLALEVDALWGNADGQVSVDELERVAATYLGALPFFSAQAETLVELARYLGTAGRTQDVVAPSVVALRSALSRLDGSEVGAARPFAELFSEALAQGDIPGSPDYLRDAAMHSPRWHRLSILEHTAMAVDAATHLSRAAGVDWKEAGAAMLLHDVGKLLDRFPKRHGGFNYFDHEEAGARWLQQRGLPEDLRFQVEHHLEIHRRSVDELIELCGGDRGRIARLLVVACADSVAKGDTPDQLGNYAEMVPKLRALARFAGIDGQALLDEVDRLRAAHFPASP